MEPVTHFLTGACISRAGLNRKSAYATAVAVLAAEAADLDVLWALRGPVEELKHHRGITHTFIAVPLVAAAVVGAVWLFDRWRMGRGRPKPQSRQAVHWGWLYGTALVAALSHLLLDWTNNYGLRPFFPLNPRWHAGSFVFIAEPVIWALLLTALLAPALLGLIGGEIGARRKPFRGQGWAVFALSAMVVLWCLRWAEHARARGLVEEAQIVAAPVRRMALEPYPVNPFRWHAILETDEFYQAAEVDTLHGTVESDTHRDVLFKPPATEATEAAKRTPLGQVYLDWGAWAVVRDVGPVAAPGPHGQDFRTPQLAANRKWTTVEFTDLRFVYSFLGPDRARSLSTDVPPLTGWVYVADGREDAGEFLNGREEK